MPKALKRLIVCCFVTVMFFAAKDMTTIAGSYDAITTNSKLTDALVKLDQINANDVIAILNGRNSTGKPIRVMFRDLAMYGLANCEAVTMKTQSGGLIIYISKRHEQAPSEAIACLIAHESQHHPMSMSKAEELKAWLKETATWNEFVRRDQTLAYSTSPLVKRENYIKKLYVRDNGSMGIEKIIAANPAYRGLN